MTFKPGDMVQVDLKHDYNAFLRARPVSWLLIEEDDTCEILNKEIAVIIAVVPCPMPHLGEQEAYVIVRNGFGWIGGKLIRRVT